MKVRNGILKGELKVKGGKLIKCEVKIKDGIIEKIKFSGDFFMHPEEKIEELEEKLKGAKIDDLQNILKSFFKKIQVIGVNKDDFLAVVMKAVKNS